MDLKWLKTFITVYEEGSFRAAAEKLYISQPSITVHIKALEEELQVNLFEREHTKVKVTQVGETYYDMAKKILSQIEDTKYEIQQAANNHRIHLVIAIAGNAAIPQVLSTIQLFNIKYPDFDIEIVLDDKTSDTLLRSHRVDIVISLNKTKSSDLHSEQYITGYMQLMFSERLRQVGLSHDAYLRHLLSSYPLYVGFMNEHAPIIERLQSEYSIWRMIEVCDADFVYKLVEQGLALTVAPVFLEEGDSSAINTLGLGGIERIYPIHVYISHLRKNEAIQPFLQFLRNEKINMG